MLISAKILGLYLLVVQVHVPRFHIIQQQLLYVDYLQPNLVLILTTTDYSSHYQHYHNV